MEEENALAVPEKCVDEASTFFVRLFCLERENRFLFTFLPLLLERDLVMLMKEYGKVEYAERLMRSELKELDLGWCEIGRWSGESGCVPQGR